MERKNLLITGATGNVGYEVIRGLHEINCQHNIFVAERNAGKAQSIFSSFGRIKH
jgi:FlaA1/EpsC-like NDP-sugar epimerase